MSDDRDTIFWGVILVGGVLALCALDGHVHAAPSPMGRARRRRPGRPVAEVPPKPPPLVYLKDDVEVLGRAVRSEIGSGTREQKIAVAWVARNLAQAEGKPIWQLLCSPCGRQRGNSRPMSTRLAARSEDLTVAAEVLASPASDDPTGGATHHVDPRAKDYSAIRRRWIEKYQWAPYGRLGKELELWGPSKTQ